MFACKNKRILVVGGAGSIGSVLVERLIKENKVYVLDNNESALFHVLQGKKNCWGIVGDIRDKETVQSVFSDFKPQVVFHAGAYKHVPLMENAPREAVNVNVLGTLNLIEEAKKWECMKKFVFISTDKAVSSNSIMGATKRLGEVMVRNQGKGFVVVRFGNVIGSRGSLYDIWDRQVAKGEPITLTDKRMNRYFMKIDDAVDLVIKATSFESGIIVLDMGEPKRIYDLAEAYNKIHKTGIKIIGIRKGELLEERLFYADEKPVKKGKYYII